MGPEIGTAPSAAERMVEEARGSVVEVSSGRRGTGAGVIWPGNSLVLTNDHVLSVGRPGRGPGRRRGRGRHGPRVTLRDGRTFDAEVLERDGGLDLALLRLTDAPADLEPVTVGDSGTLRVGELVFAVGHPWGQPGVATVGIVSGLAREGRRDGAGHIVSDVSLAPGNSGGPLLNGRGQVIGVNSQIATAGASGNIGIGFAVPADTLRSVLPRLKAGETIERPYLGVTTAEASGTGAAVAGVASAGPASRAGIRPGEDTIVGLNGRTVRGPDDVLSAIEGLEPGDRVSIVVERDGRRRTISVRLEDRPRSLPSIPGP